MESKKDVEHALDDLFNGDFIDKEDKIEEKKESLENNNEVQEEYDPFKNNSSISFKDSNKDELDEIKKSDLEVPSDEKFNYEDNTESVESEIKEDELVEVSSDELLVNDNELAKEDNKLVLDDKLNKESFKEKVFNKKMYIILCVVLFAFIVGIVIIELKNKEYILECTYEAKQNEYEMKDMYKITRKGNKIINVIGEYTYMVKDNSFKEQLQLLKHEKVPVINNSNGMSGFTYINDINDDYLRIETYLDFTLFNYDEIKKIDQDKKPISYFKIKENMNYKDLKIYFEKKGYICK